MTSPCHIQMSIQINIENVFWMTTWQKEDQRPLLGKLSDPPESICQKKCLFHWEDMRVSRR